MKGNADIEKLSVPKGLPPRNPPDLGTALLDITGTADPAGTIQRKAVQDQPYNAGGQTGIVRKAL